MDPSICAIAVNGPRACPLWPLLSAGLMETLSQGPAKGLIMKQGSAYLWGGIFYFFFEWGGGVGIQINSHHNFGLN